MKTFKQFITESKSNDLIIVDIQPSYKKSIKFLESFCDHLISEPYRKILYLYNGPDLGMEDKAEILNWLYEEGFEYDEDKIDQIPKITWFEKGYAFFRNLMDAGLDKKEIIKLINYMRKEDINDSRDIEDDVYDDVLKIENPGEDGIFIPELFDILPDHNNIIICGGGRNECLAEVEICLDVLNKNYKRLDKFIY